MKSPARYCKDTTFSSQKQIMLKAQALTFQDKNTKKIIAIKLQSITQPHTTFTLQSTYSHNKTITKRQPPH